MSGSYVFQPIALETLDPINESAVQFLNDLGHKITSVSADDKEGQRLRRIYRSTEILRHLAAWVVWKWRRPGPLADQLFKLALLLTLRSILPKVFKTLIIIIISLLHIFAQRYTGAVRPTSRLLKHPLLQRRSANGLFSLLLNKIIE